MTPTMNAPDRSDLPAPAFAPGVGAFAKTTITQKG
jgi:hypothetical protein